MLQFVRYDSHTLVCAIEEAGVNKSISNYDLNLTKMNDGGAQGAFRAQKCEDLRSRVTCVLA
jgi:hypothetical protein